MVIKAINQSERPGAGAAEGTHPVGDVGLVDGGEGWQPARIAGTEHVLQFHKRDPLATSRFAGEIVRVRKSEDAFRGLIDEHRDYLGCHATYMLEVHPDDARRIWPDIDGHIGICEHQILTD